ncbi:tRNA lysidine(34) synthetase TilS [Nonlabens sp. MB-3u-79]|uniref:tRNA lysidine(34) synthetase TilS n=1 Tax=Nonlabens sp. MB-3u-79 TaxID=2058134 RepID=UPI000C319228|nr:tRNA lysidine(34) synthetase TilS [Nonlabens sp. MB-3u-79]AUC79523.1 tRNA lysidine(34) synthetase TilS [Nonlabens sp. MB-3u-79]
MLTAFKNHISTQFPELFSVPIAIAISGGKDSTVLAHLLHQLGVKFDLIHCNFNLRGAESDADQVFVEGLAKQLGCKLYIESFETEKIAQSRGVSIQMAARDLRYQAFDNIAAKHHIKQVLVAHHLDDQLETFLINLGRGAGLHGLTGIRERNGIIARPLLIFNSSQISDFALENNIDWREDSSNSKTKYLRNRLRHEVIPLLHEALPHLKANFSNTLNYLEGSELLLDVEVARFRESGTKINHGNLEISIEKLKATLKPEAYLFELLKEYNFNLPDALELLDAEHGKSIPSGSRRLTKDREVLVLSKQADWNPIYMEIDQSIERLKLDGYQLEFKNIREDDPLKYVKSANSSNKILLDAAGLEYPFVLRNWQHGDRMQPYGMKGSKLISDLLTDCKIPSLEREKALVLASGSTILWLVGIRASKHHKITSITKSIIEITSDL